MLSLAKACVVRRLNRGTLSQAKAWHPSVDVSQSTRIRGACFRMFPVLQESALRAGRGLRGPGGFLAPLMPRIRAETQIFGVRPAGRDFGRWTAAVRVSMMKIEVAVWTGGGRLICAPLQAEARRVPARRRRPCSVILQGRRLDVASRERGARHGESPSQRG